LEKKHGAIPYNRNFVTGDTAMPIGQKYRGWKLKYLPKSYMRWLYENVLKNISEVHVDWRLKNYIEKKLGLTATPEKSESKCC
jgi:hypothetical protein